MSGEIIGLSFMLLFLLFVVFYELIFIINIYYFHELKKIKSNFKYVTLN